MKECDGGVAERKDSVEKLQLPEDSESRIRAEDEQGEAIQGMSRYEYMDIGRTDSTEGEGPAWERRGSQTSANGTATEQEAEQTVEVLKKEQEEEEEEENHHNTNKPPTLQENPTGTIMPGPDVLTAGVEVEEYEEMTRLEEVPGGWEQPDYQNLPARVRVGPEEAGGGSRCAGIGGYIKVCAGMGEPGGSTSFDNPDYWHSRLFLKPDAVRT